MHIFGSCEVSEDCWKAVHLWEDVRRLLNEFNEFCLTHEVLRTWDEQKKETWITVLWSLWYERNQRTWKNEARTARLIVDGGINIIAEWKAVRAGSLTRNNVPRSESAGCNSWHPPPSDAVKCNVDAGFRTNDATWGWGAVLRSHSGSLIAYRTGWERGRPSVKEGEAWGLLDALRWVEELGMDRVIFEVDSQVVAAAVMGHDANATEFGAIITGCRRILQTNPGFRVCFVRRNRNAVAHELARRSFSFTSPSIGYVTPTWLEDTLADMCIDLNH
ncbi:Putative ribonuclease H protein At1g65750 [Linum perenne]